MHSSRDQRKRSGVRGILTAERNGSRRNAAEKDRLLRKIQAARLAVGCASCGETGKVFRQDELSMSSSQPLWLVENAWLLEFSPLCSDCINDGERIELCCEGGTAHRFQEVGNRVICMDCGGDCDDPDITPSTELVRMRLEAAMAAREAEIGQMVGRTATLSEPERAAAATRLERLREDRDWIARRLKDEEKTSATGGAKADAEGRK